jgi:ligand-binding sensor domain-containing protein
MKSILLFTLLLIGLRMHAKENPFLFDTVQNGFVKLMTYQKEKYLITQKGLYKIGRKTLELKTIFPFTCVDACTYQNGFALATDSGLVSYTIPHGLLKNLLPGIKRKPANQVVQDAHQQLWFSLPYEGAYVIENGQARLRVQAPRIYALAATPDSNVWVGTNIGLYKVPVSKGEIMRYAEEGIEGFELPDNLAERLFSDEASNLWVLMPDQMAFIAGHSDDHELPAYSYPNGEATTVFSITKLPLSTTAFLVATSQGLVFINSMSAAQASHSGEIHQSFKERAYQIPDKLLEKPAELTGMPILSVSAIAGEIWFVTSKGVWSVASKKFIKRLISLNAT